VSTTAARRLLLVLSHSLHVRNFVASGLVDMLAARGHAVTLVVPDDLVAVVRDDVGPRAAVRPLGAIPGGGVRRRIRGVLRTASYVARADLSTYRHKIASRRTSLPDRVAVGGLRTLVRATALEPLARRVEAALPIVAEAARLLEETRPDLVVTATFIHDAVDVDIRKAARERQVPVLGFPASWDTLTSKGCFLVPPDALMVWGEDTHRHAVDYHDYPPDRVVVTGPPHFDVYAPSWPAEPREGFLSRRGIDPRHRVLLFAGTTVTYMADEPLQIRALSDLVARGELADCAIWYRPHPRRSARDVGELASLPGVYVDDQVLRHQGRGRPAYSVARDDLAHYRGLMDACEGVITAFSTMIIEAALMGKPSLVVGFGLADGTPDGVLQHAEYEHMRDVLSTPGVVLCRTADELVAGVRRVAGGELAPYGDLLRKRAREIAHAEDGRARQRIVETIERFAAGSCLPRGAR
jgi:hypothetical protein